MKITILLCCVFCFIYSASFAQSNYAVKGAVVDTGSQVKLDAVSISVLNARDSLLVKFTFSDANGAFALPRLPKGNFFLLVTYPDYADYVEPFVLDAAHPTHDFGNINMRLKTKILQEVMIKGEVRAIKIKGDTTEFNAKAFVTQPNAKVEDLLRQLPGITVDKNGKITANGQQVTKVLVDGEEFFGDDPTLVTKNIRADMVDKVQLYDKKSDQATFTGVDDGVKTKTINIKLREDKKNGIFGKIDADGGTSDYHEATVLFNKFKAKEKFSIYGTLANDGKTGLNFEDANKLGTSNNDIQFVDGGIMITGNNNDALDSFGGYYDGKGIPVVRNGGAHYDARLDNDKASINTNYKIGSIDVTGITNTTTQQTLPTGLLNTVNTQNFNNYAFRQKADVTYKLKLDTVSDLKLSTDGSLKSFKVNNAYTAATDSNGTALNSTTRNVINNGNEKIFNVSAFYTHKFKKTGRTLSWSISNAYDNNQTNGYLKSAVTFYNKSGGIDSVQNINQYKTSNISSSIFNNNITYSEPLSKFFAVVFNYGLGLNNSSADRRSFDQSLPGNYTLLDTKYSNNYKFNQLTNQFGAVFNYHNNKTTFNIGSKASAVNFKQVDEFTGMKYRRNFINWIPQAMYQYKFSQQQSFAINYSGQNTQPTIDQIQPVQVNTDPLNITIGNQLLRPSFTNNFNLRYNTYKVITDQGFNIGANFSNTYNQIVNNTTEVNGKNTIQYVNLNNHSPYNYYVYMGVSRKVKPIDVEVDLSLNTNGSISYSYINNQLDRSRNTTYSGSLNLSKYEEKKYDFNVSAGPSYTFSEMSLQPEGNNNAAGFAANASANFYLPAGFGLGSNVDYSYSAQTQSFAAQYKTILNSYIFKTFYKDEALKISLSGNDLLNQNTNFSRGISGNTTTQTNTNGIKRFFMLSVVWNFTKFGTTTDKK